MMIRQIDCRTLFLYVAPEIQQSVLTGTISQFFNKRQDSVAHPTILSHPCHHWSRFRRGVDQLSMY